MLSKTRSAAAVAVLSLASASAFAAKVLPVTGTFDDYSFNGVASPTSLADINDISKWGKNPEIAWTLTGTITLDDSNNVIGLDVRGGEWTQTFATSAGVAQSTGTFFGLAYTLAPDGRIVQTAGNGAEFQAGVLAGGTCTAVNGGPTTACDNQLNAFKNQADARLTNWNGIPEGYTLSRLFSCGSDCFFFGAIDPRPPVAWTVSNGSIVGVLTRNEPGGANGPAFNAAFAGRLNLAVVPVPGALWLLGSALGLVGLARQRRRAA